MEGLYLGPKHGVGTPGFGGSRRLGYIADSGMHSPRCVEVESFISGLGTSASVYAPMVAGVAGPRSALQWGTPGEFEAYSFSVEFGIGLGIGRSASAMCDGAMCDGAMVRWCDGKLRRQAQLVLC